MDRRWARRARTALILSLVFLLLCVPVQRLALRDLRRLEAAYVDAREPTACATQSLVPFAFDRDLDLDDLDATLVRLLRTAMRESEELQARFRTQQVVAVPKIRSARRALADALDAQVVLYRAMLEDPQGSEDELRQLGRLNNRFEREAQSARNLLLVGKPTGWDRRFVCDDEPPPTPSP